ncbi:polyprenyl diphosphate synthase [Gracilibacillus phocaeensis]|uniref:polyprenyl diphosphate synthase n=1 Tax=Gracilibacillus phocaeensis TaxID=2042304 RepID=UPI002570CD89|nr:polyprenyl diphosphate synthase [Gracilibacillus phocaeensis]
MFHQLIFQAYKKIVWLFFSMFSSFHTINKLDMTIPKHIAIIMDGNGRWAKNRGFPRSIGHYAGMLALRNIIEDCHKMGLKHLTLYAFSSENWKRPGGEVDYLIKDLPSEIFKSEILKVYHKKNIKINFIGDINSLPPQTVELLKVAEKKTSKNNGMHVHFALNYGGRKDILQAAKQILINESKETILNISEETFTNYLYTKGVEDPELIIRTGGDLRISNFLLWQISSSEIWFTKKYWPSFNAKLLMKAMEEYDIRKAK